MKGKILSTRPVPVLGAPHPRILVVLSGEPPKKPWLQTLAKTADIVVGADAGAAPVLKAGLRLDYLIGDLDSIPAPLREKMDDSRTIHDIGQEETDGEKALRYVTDRWRRPDVILLGGVGPRLDHLFGTMLAAARCALRCRRLQLLLADHHAIFANPRVELTVPKGATLSLLPLGPCQGVSASGLRWHLENEALEIGSRGVSNVATTGTVTVSRRVGHLMVMRRVRTTETVLGITGWDKSPDRWPDFMR